MAERTQQDGFAVMPDGRVAVMAAGYTMTFALSPAELRELARHLLAAAANFDDAGPAVDGLMTRIQGGG